MNKPPATSTPAFTALSSGRFQVFLETALVFMVFFVQGAWPVPDVNEPHYLSKAIHFWNPDWITQDFFLDSADTQTVFYFTFGWLTLVLPPLVVAWVGRLLSWALLAYAWRRLSMAVLPARWWSILTAALFLCLLFQCHMAGEWVVGGIEAKGFAYVFVFLGLENLVRNRWNLMWLCFGGAALFHVLVGGWAVVAGGIAWIIAGSSRPKLRTMWPGLLAGGLLSLPALIPSIHLTWGVDAEIVSQANQIYVFQRLGHHLNPAAFPLLFIIRFSLLALLWLFIWRITHITSDKPLAASHYPEPDGSHRLQSFVAGAVIIAVIGALIGVLGKNDPAWAAGLLRFYWFRLADVAVPLGVALGGCSLIHLLKGDRSLFTHNVARPLFEVAIIVVCLHFGALAVYRSVPSIPRAYRLPYYQYWRDACQWVADPRNIPPGSRFLTPKRSQTFKWYTSQGDKGHSEVVIWKDVPQDADSIVEWWRRMNDIHANPDGLPIWPWHPTLATQGEKRLKKLGEKYDVDYIITASHPRLDLTVVYKNPAYIIYQLDQKK